jgi:FkbM family methyltransferase
MAAGAKLLYGYVRLRDFWNLWRGFRRVGLKPWRPLIIFDVGANNGSSFLPFCRLFTQWEVYAFEPTPQLVSALHVRSRGAKNYHIIPKAIASTEGRAPFNVAAHADWGCSSLLEFRADRAETWAGRTDLEVTERIEVDVIRLDSFIRERGVAWVDFLHIDAQGMDLDVLRSLGSEISRVRGGVVEAPCDPRVRLYEGQPTKTEIVAFLAEHGFEVCGSMQQQNEENLYFRRKRGA